MEQHPATNSLVGYSCLDRKLGFPQEFAPRDQRAWAWCTVAFAERKYNGGVEVIKWQTAEMERNGNVTFPTVAKPIYFVYQALPYHFPVCNIEKLGNGHGDEARCNRYKSNSSCVGANMLVDT